MTQKNKQIVDMNEKERTRDSDLDHMMQGGETRGGARGSNMRILKFENGGG